jgi:hypothetical protein
MHALDRTHRLRQDLDWLPRELKLLRWSATGACWVGVTGTAVAVTLASAGMLAHVAAVAAAGGIYAGGRFGRSLMLRRLGRLAHGGLDLVRLANEAEGHLVHVSGRIRADKTLPSFLHRIPAVYRRMTFQLGRSRFIHEAAVDFDIVDTAGARLRVHVDSARLLVPPTRDLADYPAALFAGGAMPPSLARVLGAHAVRAARDSEAIPSAELLLEPGSFVEVIGYKTETIDPVAGARVGRAPPMRVALRSGRIPIIITSPLLVQPPDEL